MEKSQLEKQKVQVIVSLDLLLEVVAYIAQSNRYTHDVAPNEGRLIIESIKSEIAYNDKALRVVPKNSQYDLSKF